MGMTIPGRTEVRLHMLGVRLDSSQPQVDIPINQESALFYTCIDCGFETTECETMLYRQQYPTGHSRWMRFKRWLAG